MLRRNTFRDADRASSGRAARFDGQGMDVSDQQVSQGVIDGAMPGQRRQAIEAGTGDGHVEMATPIAGTGMTGMAVAVVAYGKGGRLECIGQARLDRRHARLAWHGARVRENPFAHGSSARKGRTSMRAYTPCSM